MSQYEIHHNKPKWRSVYDRTVLLDWQSVPWSTHQTPTYKHALEHLFTHENQSHETQTTKSKWLPGFIFLSWEINKENTVVSTHLVTRGNIMQSHHEQNGTALDDQGELNVKCQSLVLKWLKKYSGVLTTYSSNKIIIGVELEPKQ